MTNENEGLMITPAELKFRFQLGKTIPTQIILYNPTTERYAFKVKTTSPKKYCVRPSSGFVDPQSNRHVEVIMQSQKEYPADLGVCRDKFLLQSVAAPGKELEITAEMFDRNLGHVVKESKLKVLLEGPPAPPPPIDEESVIAEEPLPTKASESPVHAAGVDSNGFSGVNQETMEEMKKLKEERDSLRRKVDLLSQDTWAEQSPAVQVLGKGGFTMVHVIVVAILAFLIGHYTR